MNEKLLQFIWQFQYFNKNELTTANGEQLVILKHGSLNDNQGPDFADASVKIDNIILAGNIEIHIKSSDWHRHNHTGDGHYKNIILHVVWENDVQINDNNGRQIPTLVLQDRIAKVLLERYTMMMASPVILCQQQTLPALSELGWTSWKERLVAERLTRKATKVLAYLEQTKQHWEEVFWWLLAANFGMKVNSELFEQVAQSISVNILAKHKNQIHQLEALLLGQANLLEDDFEDDYAILLQKEYAFLQKKYKLQRITIQPDYLRMRPANFPAIRLAQLAMLIKQSTHLFVHVKELESVKELKLLFAVTANDYWHYHYRFDDAQAYQPKRLGNSTVDNIIINTIVPILFAYGSFTQQEKYKHKAIQWLTQTKNEVNNIISDWKEYGQQNLTAFDSQAFIELTNNYCINKRCLECAVGNKILKG